MTPLAEVIVEYTASVELTDTAWSGLVLALASKTFTEAVPLLSQAEAEFKAETGRTLPAAYRSAKSVCLSALKNNVTLMDFGPSPGPRGKTAVSNEVKMKGPKGSILLPHIDFVRFWDAHKKEWANHHSDSKSWAEEMEAAINYIKGVK